MDDIYKLPIAEIADALISYREKRGLKTTKGDAAELVKDMFSVIGELLKEENNGISLGKVGLVYNGLQKGRKGQHPQTKEPIDIPDKRAIKFKPYSKFKEDLNA